MFKFAEGRVGALDVQPRELPPESKDATPNQFGAGLSKNWNRSGSYTDHLYSFTRICASGKLEI